MNFRRPQNTDKYHWTDHSIFKMSQYGLSAQRIIRVIRSPRRKEIGIVPNTIAVMQPASIGHHRGREKWSQEIWAMYQINKSKLQETNSNKIQYAKLKIKNSVNQQIRIISAWRYPGVSPQKDPIPAEILSEIEAIGKN